MTTDWQPRLPPSPAPLLPPTVPPPVARTRPGRGRKVAVATAAAVTLAVASGGVGASVALRLDDEAATTTTPATVTPVVAGARAGADLTRSSLALDGERLDVAGVLASLAGSVVSVDTTIAVQQGPYWSEGQGAGTGIVMDDRGHVLTNAHVVEGATEVTVTLDHDDTARAARVVAADAAEDIAVLEVADTEGLVPATFGRDDEVQIGDEVVAVGNALALEGDLSVTRGIVSGLDRSIQTANGTLEGLVQTDASISSGNSGGPLVDALGRVIGVNSAVATGNGSIAAENVGFVISVDRALAVAADLLGAAEPAAAA